MSTRPPEDVVPIGHVATRPTALGRKKIAKPPTVANVLRQLARDGFAPAKDVRTEHGTVDHVVFGPTGVFTVIPKSWRRHVWVRSRPARVLVGRNDVTDTLRLIVHQALELERRARREGLEIEVRALVVVTGTRVPAGQIALGRATILDVERLAGTVTAPTERPLGPEVLGRLVDAVCDPPNVVPVSFGGR